MRFAPLSEGSAHAAVARHVEAGSEFANVVENQEAAGREHWIPKIELGHGRPVLMRAGDKDQLGIAGSLLSRLARANCFRQSQRNLEVSRDRSIAAPARTWPDRDPN